MISFSSLLSNELQNIPISMSLLHEKEYNNLRALMKKDQVGKRRACSEKNTIRTSTNGSAVICKG